MSAILDPCGKLESGNRGSTTTAMGLMHNYVIQCMRVRLGGIAKQVPRVCVPFLHTGDKYISLIRKLSGINGGLNSIHLRRKNITH